ARAEVSRARIERDYLCERARTDGALEQAGAVPGAAGDLGRKQCATARAAVRASEAQLHELGVVEARAAEEAPIDGLVLEWLAEPGENVMPGRPLVRIGGSAMELTVALTEADLARGVGVGTAATVSARGGSPIATEIVSLAPLARGPGRTVEATLRLPEPLAQGAYAGMSLDVAVTLERVDDTVSVPSDALLLDGDGAAIFVARDGRLARVRVTPGLVAGGWVAVDPPPAADSRVVVGALRGLEDEQPVYAVDAPGVLP
ncbi:MAG: efflux RND transporter periplasmic adaptor subunit, partial [Deltaproteobacteria bacterium]